MMQWHKIAALITVSLLAGFTSILFSSEFPCYVTQEQSYICELCAHPASGATTWGKCGAPTDSGYCDVPVYRPGVS